ncbi:MAG: methyltransferase domain-containing protein, partial [Gemmatimonadota bacterium]|nr:methyltransferase domain-containing protein [Gemmatimonadota bacterium]
MRPDPRRPADPTPVVVIGATLTVRAVVEQATRELERLGFAGAAVGGREIVAALLDVGRHWPALHGETRADALLLGRALHAARRLAHGMPFQYAVGRASFRGLTLEVDERVLIPRPETEQLVEAVLDETRDARGGTAVDVGTGSGAIALALAEEGAFEHVVGIDLSADALAVARYNAEALAQRLRAAVEFRQGSLL